MPSWFFETYEMIFGPYEVWLAAVVILACARNFRDDLVAASITLVAGLYVGAGLILSLVYLFHDTVL